MKTNPNHNTYLKPLGYTDLGWQLYSGNSEEVKKCHDLRHKRKEFDNSLYLNRCTEVIYICDECKNIYHIDMSD
jgi:hypothetical protein